MMTTMMTTKTTKTTVATTVATTMATTMTTMMTTTTTTATMTTTMRGPRQEDDAPSAQVLALIYLLVLHVLVVEHGHELGIRVVQQVHIARPTPWVT